jgi:hypothetical protein
MGTTRHFHVVFDVRVLDLNRYYVTYTKTRLDSRRIDVLSGRVLDSCIGSTLFSLKSSKRHLLFLRSIIKCFWRLLLIRRVKPEALFSSTPWLTHVKGTHTLTTVWHSLVVTSRDGWLRRSWLTGSRGRLLGKYKETGSDRQRYEEIEEN